MSITGTLIASRGNFIVLLSITELELKKFQVNNLSSYFKEIRKKQNKLNPIQAEENWQ